MHSKNATCFLYTVHDTHVVLVAYARLTSTVTNRSKDGCSHVLSIIVSCFISVFKNPTLSQFIWHHATSVCSNLYPVCSVVIQNMVKENIWATGHSVIMWILLFCFRHGYISIPHKNSKWHVMAVKRMDLMGTSKLCTMLRDLALKERYWWGTFADMGNLLYPFNCDGFAFISDILKKSIEQVLWFHF